MFFNTAKTYALLATLSGMFLTIGFLFGGSAGLHIAFIVGLLVNGTIYYFSDKMVLTLYRAQALDEHQYASIHTMIEQLAHQMKIPKPKLWRIPMPVPNAFATGRSPRHASVALTDSLLEILEPDELRGVLAHELGHIKNYDMLVGTFAAIFASAIGYLANMLQYLTFWQSFQNNRRSSRNPFLLFLVALIAPIAALLVRLAISRSREYLADETGARYADPLELARALKKIESHAYSTRTNAENMQEASTASLFITNPFRCENLLSLFSTHPPIEERIARLEQIHANRFHQ